MPRDWQADLGSTRKHLPQVKRVLGEALIVEAPWEQDAKENTDLIVLRGRDLEVAVRLREPGRYDRWGCPDFTVRAERPRSGNETELAKIIKGMGRYLFYGFRSADDAAVCAYILGDLNVFRLYFQRYACQHRGDPPGVLHDNYDGSSTFRAFTLEQMPPEFFVAKCLPARAPPPRPVRPPLAPTPAARA